MFKRYGVEIAIFSLKRVSYKTVRIFSYECAISLNFLTFWCALSVNLHTVTAVCSPLGSKFYVKDWQAIAFNTKILLLA